MAQDADFVPQRPPAREHLLLDRTLPPEGGALRPDTGRPGLGPDVEWSDAEPYRVAGTRPA
ncbi:hypothetical protein [Streptomyces sp. NPDC005930]|uniref:hypothetical protein n=1 Tax=Streptomyces sp. NPDC005930 TaxID=3364736 RepID=UPI0036BD1575